MKKEIHAQFKQYFRSELLKTRGNLGVTQEAMAEQMELNTHSISELEGGKTSCRLETLLMYLKVSGVDPARFITEFFNCIIDAPADGQNHDFIP